MTGKAKYIPLKRREQWQFYKKQVFTIANCEIKQLQHGVVFHQSEVKVKPTNIRQENIPAELHVIGCSVTGFDNKSAIIGLN